MRGERDEIARARVLEALRSGKSVTAAAKAGGVARQTPYQWADRGDAEMQAALEARARLRSDDEPATPSAQAVAPPARGRLHKDERLALKALREVARGSDSDMCRVGAAKALLDYRRKLRESAAAKPSAPPAAPAPGDSGEDAGAIITRIVGRA
jgi:transposase-like protein